MRRAQGVKYRCPESCRCLKYKLKFKRFLFPVYRSPIESDGIYRVWGLGYYRPTRYIMLILSHLHNCSAQSRAQLALYLVWMGKPWTGMRWGGSRRVGWHDIVEVSRSPRHKFFWKHMKTQYQRSWDKLVDDYTEESIVEMNGRGRSLLLRGHGVSSTRISTANMSGSPEHGTEHTRTSVSNTELSKFRLLDTWEYPSNVQYPMYVEMTYHRQTNSSTMQHRNTISRVTYSN